MEKEPTHMQIRTLTKETGMKVSKMVKDWKHLVKIQCTMGFIKKA